MFFVFTNKTNNFLENYLDVRKNILMYLYLQTVALTNSSITILTNELKLTFVIHSAV
jgi:hypothetical protein